MTNYFSTVWFTYDSIRSGKINYGSWFILLNFKHDLCSLSAYTQMHILKKKKNKICIFRRASHYHSQLKCLHSVWTKIYGYQQSMHHVLFVINRFWYYCLVPSSRYDKRDLCPGVDSRRPPHLSLSLFLSRWWWWWTKQATSSSRLHRQYHNVHNCNTEFRVVAVSNRHSRATGEIINRQERACVHQHVVVTCVVLCRWLSSRAAWRIAE